MKAMMVGFVGIVVIGVAAYFVLEQAGFSSADVFSSPSVRLD
ncbi:MAG: hypothetical protein QNJ09_05995 [Paracoccaceae bacterium]|nr:hypothetical protein [Paracoccaceae bacterium]